MGDKYNILQYRQRLDKALASHDLTDEERIKKLVKNQVVRSSGNELEDCIDVLADKRAKELSNFLGMLRSAGGSDDETLKRREAHGDWKVKQDSHEYRVMYRKGPEGTPYHTLLVEGYVNGPLDVCLCIGTETSLYRKWWPQTIIPPFKVTYAECLQKIRIGENISLVRMKVPWPLSAREALVHFFVYEYFQDDLVIVLTNSILSTHGFNREGLPDTQDVRVDLVGGFAVRKVTNDRSYFRTIANVDIKLDIIPLSFINFVSRQLIGSGFKLYQKEVASVCKGDQDFANALKEPLYAQIRKALSADNTKKEVLEPKAIKKDLYVLSAEQKIESMQTEARDMNDKLTPNGHATHYEPEPAVIINDKAPGEIEEIEEERTQTGSVGEDRKESHESSTDHFTEKFYENSRKKVVISSEVDQALGILEKAISIFREYGLNPETRPVPQLTESNQICTSGFRLKTTNSSGGETSYNRIAPASPEEDIYNPIDEQQTAISSSNDLKAAALDNTSKRDEQVISEAIDNKEIASTKRKSNKTRYCCLHFLSGQQMV